MKFSPPILLAVSAIATMACGAPQQTPESQLLSQPGIVSPADDAEKQILARAAEMNEGDTESVGGREVLVLRSYRAASGRDCKSLRVASTDSTSSSSRLICHFDDRWEFAPYVQP